MEELEEYRQEVLRQLQQSATVLPEEVEVDPEEERLNSEIGRLQQELANLKAQKAEIESEKAAQMATEEEELEEISQFKRNELAWEYEQELDLERRRNMFAKMPTGKQLSFAKSLGIKNPEDYTSADLRDEIDFVLRSRNKPTEKQISYAKSLGIENPESMGKKELSAAISSAKGVSEEEYLDEEEELEENDYRVPVSTLKATVQQIPQENIAEIIKTLSPEDYAQFAGGLQSEALQAIFNNQEEQSDQPDVEAEPESGEGEGEADLSSLL